MPVLRRIRPRLAWRLSPLLLGLLAGCAAPAVQLYTLGAPAIAMGAVGNTAALPSRNVVEVSRAALPDYLDTQDIVIRRGNRIDRSSSGRWASRLSLGATDLITARLAALRPDLLITDQPQAATLGFRLLIDISRLDVSDTGTATLEANWTLVPMNESVPLAQGRASFAETGPVAADADVVHLTDAVLDRLAARIGQDLRNLAPRRS